MTIYLLKVIDRETSLVAQWVRLHSPHAGGQVQHVVWELHPTCNNRKHARVLCCTLASVLRAEAFLT